MLKKWAAVTLSVSLGIVTGSMRRTAGVIFRQRRFQAGGYPGILRPGEVSADEAMSSRLASFL